MTRTSRSVVAVTVVARHGLDRCELAEIIARVAGVDDASGSGHRRRALQDHEELATEATFAQDHLAGLDVEALGDPGHLVQLFLRAGGEPGDSLQTAGIARRATVGSVLILASLNYARGSNPVHPSADRGAGRSARPGEGAGWRPGSPRGCTGSGPADARRVEVASSRASAVRNLRAMLLNNAYR